MAEYPLHLVRRRTLADGREVVIRPIRAEDEMQTRDFYDHLSEDARELRFMKFVKAVSDKLIHFFTHIDRILQTESKTRPTGCRASS